MWTKCGPNVEEWGRDCIKFILDHSPPHPHFRAQTRPGTQLLHSCISARHARHAKVPKRHMHTERVLPRRRHRYGPHQDWRQASRGSRRKWGRRLRQRLPPPSAGARAPGCPGSAASRCGARRAEWTNAPAHAWAGATWQQESVCLQCNVWCKFWPTT